MRFLSFVLVATALALRASAVPLSSDGIQNPSGAIAPSSTDVTNTISAPSSPKGTNAVPENSGTPSAGKSGKYLVKLKDGASKADVLGILPLSSQSNGSDEKSWTVINGFSGNLDPATVNSLRGSSSVEYVEEDVAVHTTSTQMYATWGLQRISSENPIDKGNASALAYQYTYDKSAGSDIDIYVVDTGININHTQFCGGRATWGATFGGYPDLDDNGHGTHVAATAAGNMFGVAKNANVIAVKVLSGSGGGLMSDVIDGLEFVYEQVQTTKKPSIVSMSLGGEGSFIMDSVVNGLVQNGIHVVVAAGNDNAEVKDFSPARAKDAITVGAANVTDERAYYSNFGPEVALFAPGSDVISAWGTDDLALNKISGTSMATPHVSGMVAYLLALEGDCSPKQMKKRLQQLAVKDALKDVPKDTKNYLAQLPSSKS